MATSFGFNTIATVTLDQKTINDIAADPNGDVGKFLAERGKLFLVLAKHQVGVETGRLRESIKMINHRVGNVQELWIGTEDSIGLLHHEGSRPHAIMARGPGDVRFTSHGRIVYARIVHHPGTKPNRFLTDNLVLFRL